MQMNICNVAGDGEFSDETVKELESLKSVFRTVKDSTGNDEGISARESQISIFCNLNCSGSARKEISNAVEKNGKVLVKILQKFNAVKNNGEDLKSTIKTEIDIPSVGIHQLIKNGANVHITKEKEKSKKSGNEVNKMNNFPGSKYQALDMAEYIFWTGDEKDVALAIEEFLERGLMSRQQAIDFLQSIKLNLHLMQSHYQRLKKLEDKIFNENAADQNIKSQNKEAFIKKPAENFTNVPKGPELTPEFDSMNVNSGSSKIGSHVKRNSHVVKFNDANAKSKGENYSTQINKKYTKLPVVANTIGVGSITSDDNEEMMENVKERLRRTDTLQEAIFDLAKIMFYESLIKGNAKAQKTMQRFSSFLQNEIKVGQISTTLQKKILDILLTALMDALSDCPELANVSAEEFQIT